MGGAVVRCVRLLAVLIVSFSALPAWGHDVPFPKHDQVKITSEAVEVQVDYLIEPGDLARRTREIFDGDGNGRLDDAERERLVAYLQQSALHFLKVELNGEPLKLEVVDHRLSGAELETSSALELVGRWTLRAAEVHWERSNRLVFHDRHKDGAVRVPVHVSVAGDETEYVLDAHRPKIRVGFKRP